MDELKKAIAKMQDFYCRNGSRKSLEYTFGFFDALRVLQEIADKEGRA